MKKVNSKAVTLLGFASKAGALCYGFSDTLRAIKKSRVKGVLFACDISDKSRKELLFNCNKFEISFCELKGMNMTELSHAIGRKCAIAAVTEDSFYNSIVSYIQSDN